VWGEGLDDVGVAGCGDLAPALHSELAAAERSTA
jgi:hypothetical protein